MLRLTLAGVCVAMCLAGTAVADKARASNPDLARAKLAIEKVNFDKALASLTRALERGGNPPRRLAEIYRLLGEVYITVGKAKQARDYFGRLLMLKPYAKLSAGASPKLTAVLESVRRSLQNTGALHVRAKVNREDGTVTLVRDADPLKLVDKVIIEYTRASTLVAEQRSSRSGTYVVRIPAETLRNLKLIAADKWGNQLRVFDLGSTHLATTRPIWKRWTSWAIAGGALFVAGTIAGVGASGAQRDLDVLRANSVDHFFSEFESVRSRGRRYALIANISFGLAVASAATSVFLYLKQRNRAGEQQPEKTRVVAAPVPFVGPSGAGIAVVGSFD